MAPLTELVDGVHHVVGRERGAVGEADAGTQVQDHRSGVDGVDALEELQAGLSVGRVQGHEGLVGQAADLEPVGRDGGARIDVADGRLHEHDEGVSRRPRRGAGRSKKKK